ncbi:YceD family protein [Schaalia sp. ZJ1691]|uniref:YceD family protein n=1 Tax=Schaalia sp. ZJ1691 TaxID=2709404 RepID=UPI0013EB48F2|nr:YceD family protein [Schaalia sp. ZJ1691]
MSERPLEIALHALPRSIGSTLHAQTQWIVPDDLGTPAMAVDPGTVLPIDVDLTSVDGGVLVDVRTHATLRGECVRCLDPVIKDCDIHSVDVYVEQAASATRVAGSQGKESHRGAQRGVDAEGDGEFLDDEYLIGPHDTVDIETQLRDAIITLVDDRPLCRPDCMGLCDVCGEKWEELPEDHRHEVIDPRLASLAHFFDEADARQSAENGGEH